MDTSSSTLLRKNKTATPKEEGGHNNEQQQGAHSEDIDENVQQSTNNLDSSSKTTVDEANNTTEDDTPLPKPFRFCTEQAVDFGGSQKLTLQYPCMGDHYDEFTRVLHSLADTLPEPMGRRDFPVASDRNILVLGNSHTRQMMDSLICQFRNEVVEFARVVASNVTLSTNVRFANNSTIISITNNPIMDSPDWVALIEKGFRRPLNSYDGIVLGKFNANNGSKPPKLCDVAKVYDGPVVYVSMFARYGNPELTANLAFIKSVNSTRHNLSTINGRKYIDTMKMECGAMDVDSAGLCYEDSDNKNVPREANSMHRCVGAKGGHPDLIAWEVAEKLNALRLIGDEGLYVHAAS